MAVVFTVVFFGAATAGRSATPVFQPYSPTCVIGSFASVKLTLVDQYPMAAMRRTGVVELTPKRDGAKLYVSILTTASLAAVEANELRSTSTKGLRVTRRENVIVLSTQAEREVLDSALRIMNDCG
jgi:hypothetical protein